MLFKKLIRKKKINLFKQGHITQANDLRKFLKRKLRKASEYYNSKVKDLFSNKPKQCHRKIKEICGKKPVEVTFHLPDPLTR